MSVQSKHFTNAPENLVVESLQGLCTLNPQLALDVADKVVYVAKPDRSKVALICGGGSGHEPAHAGFAMACSLASTLMDYMGAWDGDADSRHGCSAAACGSVFASPNTFQVRRAIDLVENEKGTVIIVKNYTGDILNFGLAKEQYAAQHPEKSDRVKFVIVGDDVAVGKTQGKIVGRRGLAGTCLVYKIAGALAKRGGGLDEVNSIAQWVAANVGTIGVGLEHCHVSAAFIGPISPFADAFPIVDEVPGTAAGESHLKPNEIEIGMGIHNEPGNRRLSPVPPLNELIPQLLELLTSTTDPERSFLPFKGQDKIVLLINNLGGTSELEMAGVVRESRTALEAQGFQIERVLAGTFMTSLNMPGFSITVLLLPQSSDSSAPSASLLLELLDEKPDVPGWKWTAPAKPLRPSEQTKQTSGVASAAAVGEVTKLRVDDPQAFIASVKRTCKALIEAEPELTRMDSIAGDGDCGLTLKDGANAVLKDVESGKISGENVVGSAIAVSKVAEEQMGGTSGALYSYVPLIGMCPGLVLTVAVPVHSIFFSALAQGLQASSSGAGTLTAAQWATSLTSALEKLYTYTRARPPSRTLVDPLEAFVVRLSASQGSDFAGAVQAAGEAAQKTRDLEAKAGRSAYVEGDRLRQEQVPDPGAWGIKVILEGLQG
ncbi:uncharacterized protein FIBRA_02386 [Fibroporia radiculosa]|uniref:Dihydroxyacetone kinase n=1 Tax=Fibroporia radiculosa TaxID=599839 RepID=J4I912_9APHY|nr:uncharacterized protein FIBRA_02386 [Fibroporia radiculosa]CCM00356.1 predicted protein [Fibroporia radiculosa]